MLTRVDTEEFVIYTQTVERPEEGDEAARLKYIRSRNKLAEWFDRVLADREVIVTWAEGANIYSITATRKTQGYNNLPPRPFVDEHFDMINGRAKPGVTHITFYTKPEMLPVKLELDLVLNMIVRREGLNQIIE